MYVEKSRKKYHFQNGKLELEGKKGPKLVSQFSDTLYNFGSVIETEKSQLLHLCSGIYLLTFRYKEVNVNTS